MSYDSEVRFEDLLGKTLKSITGLHKGSGTINFVTVQGRGYTLAYYQDCCASASIEDIAGNPSDLLETPITMAEEVFSHENPADVDKELIEYQDSFTWTYYKLATIKGYVTIRWYGSSNGCYSETATFQEEK